MDFASAFAAIHRASARCLAAQRRGAGFAISGLPRPFDMPLVVIEPCHFAHDRLEHAAGYPFLEALMQRTAAHAKPLPMDGFPLATCPQHVPYPIQYRAVIHTLSSRFPFLVDLWNQLPYRSPQWTRHMKIVDILRFCVTILLHGVSVLMLSWSTLSEPDTPSFSTLILIYA